jgi:hypothetical protein
MSDLRNRLKALGVSEDRLAVRPGNAFTKAYAEHLATENTPKPPALPAKAQSTIDAARVFQQYQSGNAIERAYLREHHGAAVELGRRVTRIDSPESPPEPPKAAE